MKLKTLAALCKKEGVFCLYDRANADGEIVEQWLGTASAVYPLPDLPYLTEAHLVALFDITEKQLAKMSIKHGALPESINFEHTDPAEIILNREKMTLAYDGLIVRPLMTRDGLELINDAYLSPLADVADELELYERHTASGQIYFAAKMGLMLVGVIMPTRLVEEQFVESVEALARRSRAALTLKNERKAQNKADAGQITIDEGSGDE